MTDHPETVEDLLPLALQQLEYEGVDAPSLQQIREKAESIRRVRASWTASEPPPPPKQKRSIPKGMSIRNIGKITAVLNNPKEK
jgi:hypothetical protein